MKRTTWMLLGSCIMVGLLVFLVTVKAGNASSVPATGNAVPAPLSQWLALSPAQQRDLEKDDPNYDADWMALRNAVWAERQSLATMLQATEAKEADVLAQVDRVSAAENALQRRVTQHILRLRAGLTPEQQQNLMGLCANAISGQGRGMGMGMGRGMGNGRGYRGGRGAQ
jgi:Spy/CpxP family protein refolding chaperone